MLFRHLLTFTDASSVHHPDERGAVLAVGGDAVLSGLEYVAVVFLHLQGAAESQLSSTPSVGNNLSYNSQYQFPSSLAFFVHVWEPGENEKKFFPLKIFFFHSSTQPSHFNSFTLPIVPSIGLYSVINSSRKTLKVLTHTFTGDSLQSLCSRRMDFSRICSKRA